MLKYIRKEELSKKRLEKDMVVWLYNKSNWSMYECMCNGRVKL